MAKKKTQQYDFIPAVKELLDTIETLQHWVNLGTAAPRCSNPAKLPLREAKAKGLYPYDLEHMPIWLHVGKMCVREPFTRDTLIIDEVLVDSLIDDVTAHALHWQMLSQRHYGRPHEFGTLEPRGQNESRKAFLLRAQAWCQMYLAGASPELEPDTPPAQSQGDDSQMSGEARALAVLTDHPDWTDKRIAEEAGVHPKTLYRYERYKTARQMLKDSGRAGLPRGFKTGDGDIEAYE